MINKKIKEMIENENTKKYIICIILFFIGFFASWILRTNIYNDTDTNGSTVEQLDRIRENQSDIIRDLESVRHGIRSDIETVNRTEERVIYIETKVNDIRENNARISELIGESQRRIEENKRILYNIREQKE